MSTAGAACIILGTVVGFIGLMAAAQGELLGWGLLAFGAWGVVQGLRGRTRR